MQETLNPERDGQDEIDASKAPLLDHLIELRQRLMYAGAAFIVMFFVCFAFAKEIYQVLVWPYTWVTGEQDMKLIATHFLEQIYTHIKLSMFGAAVLSFPVAAAQIYKFVAPGLYKNERQAFLPYLIATPIFFALAIAVVFFVAMPVLIQFSLGLAGDEIDILPKVSEYLSLIMQLVFGFGICFQLPVILTLLAKAGLITSEQLTTGRRYAIVAIFGVAAIFTPPDPISMIIMALPTMLIYELAIFAVKFVEKARGDIASDDDDEPEPEPQPEAKPRPAPPPVDDDLGP